MNILTNLMQEISCTMPALKNGGVKMYVII
jgi:hypothetical protein